MKEPNGYVCHSGGCEGSDLVWENRGNEYGVETKAYSFRGHYCKSPTPVVLGASELKEGLEHVYIAGPSLRKPLSEQWPPMYVQNLLARNWFQVKNSTAIYAIGQFMNSSKALVDGGTGWAVQMAVDNHKPVYFFDQKEVGWFVYDFEQRRFIPFHHIPVLTQHFAGIGTRKIDKNGIMAVGTVYKQTFGV